MLIKRAHKYKNLEREKYMGDGYRNHMITDSKDYFL
jgi:hypothetical protein